MTAFDPAAALPAAEAALSLLAVTHGLADAFQQRKTELAALDFDDLLIRARDLIAGEARADLRKHLAAQTRLLLVDEFQDTDPLQVELVRALCDGRVADGKLFFVGDYKQSIYRFRGADPHVFRRLRDEIPAHGRLPLTLNFRSQPAVIEFVNALFCNGTGPRVRSVGDPSPAAWAAAGRRVPLGDRAGKRDRFATCRCVFGADAGLGSVRLIGLDRRLTHPMQAGRGPRCREMGRTHPKAMPAGPRSATAAARRSGSRGGSAACSTRQRNLFATRLQGPMDRPCARFAPATSRSSSAP